MNFALGNFPGPAVTPDHAPEPTETPIVSPEPEQPKEQLAAPKFKTALRLTKEQEERLIDHVQQRIAEVRIEMGLTLQNHVEPNSWMAIRQRNEQTYQGDLSWRSQIDGSIFQESNFSYGSGQRHVRYISARLQDDLLGTSPFFAAIGENPDKQTLAKQVEEFIQAEVERSEVRGALREAQKIALIRNEAVVKTTWVKDSTPFIGPATVLVDANGAPILTPDKQLYVMKDDNFFPDPSTEGLMMLEKDPSFRVIPGEVEGTLEVPSTDLGPRQVLQYAEIDELPQRITHFEGIKVATLDYRSFLCPLRHERVEDADINVHLYRKPLNALKQIYGGIDVSDMYFSTYDETGEVAPKYEQGERDDWPSILLQEVTIGECYVRFDADEDGQDEEILLVLDLKSGRAIYYNFLGNHYSQRPFSVIPGIERVPGRWYGRGIYSLLEDALLFEDAELNRANYRQSKAASITFAYRNACESWSNGVAPIIGDKRINWINSTDFDAKNKPPVFRVNLAEEIEPDLMLSDRMRQAADGTIGAISLKDASMAGLEQSNTATGVANLQASSDIIAKANAIVHTDAITRVLRQVVDVALEHMDPTSLLFQKDTSELITLNRDEVRALAKNVRLLLTRSRSTQLFNTNQQALAIAKDYHGLLATAMPTAKILRPLYIGQLRSLEITDVDLLLPEVTPEMEQQWVMQQQMMAQQAAQQEQSQEQPKE